MSKKFELTDEIKELPDGTILHRIKYLRDVGPMKAGDLGGWLEKESNLSHEGDCCVCGDARVFESARVFENALVYGNSQVFEDAEVYGSAEVCGNIEVGGNAKIGGNVKVGRNTKIHENAEVNKNEETSKKSKKFEDGSLVRHITGGPIMAVECYVEDDKVLVEWFDKKDRCHERAFWESHLVFYSKYPIPFEGCCNYDSGEEEE